MIAIVSRRNSLAKRYPTRVTLALLVLFCLTCGVPAVRGQDPFPDETMMFFNLHKCPTGWEPYLEGDGRLVVPASSGLGAPVNVRLAPGAEPTHGHPINFDISLDSVSYALVAGCGANCLAEAKTQHFAFPSQRATTNLPYVELFICTKVDDPNTSGAAIPPGLMSFFFKPRCPRGWTEVLTAQGRVPVGLVDGGNPEVAFGGPAISPVSEPKHRHFYSGSLTTRAQDIAGLSGGLADGYARNGSYSYAGFSGETSSNWPYILLRLCRKN